MAFDSHPGIAADQLEISYILGSICYLDANDKVTDNPASLSDYQLDEPASVVTVRFADGSSETLIVGMLDPSKNHYYAKKPDSDTVYTVSRYSCIRFFYSVYDFVSREILPVTFENLSSVTILSKTARYPVIEI